MLNNGNGGPPGIQTWTAKYQRTIQVLFSLLNSPDHTITIRHSDRTGIYFDELIELGIIEQIEPKVVKLNIEELRKHSVVVSDEVFDKMTDINWMREQRKKLGLIKGDIKGPEFRAKQQERRKKRRAYAKEQKAKRLAQPPSELPLSDIILPD